MNVKQDSHRHSVNLNCPKYHMFLTEVLSYGSNKRQTCIKKYLVMNSLRYQNTSKTEQKHTKQNKEKQKRNTKQKQCQKDISYLLKSSMSYNTSVSCEPVYVHNRDIHWGESNLIQWTFRCRCDRTGSVMQARSWIYDTLTCRKLSRQLVDAKPALG